MSHELMGHEPIQVNGIFIPAGILQAPFYSASQDVARNYGSVGCICGNDEFTGMKFRV